MAREVFNFRIDGLKELNDMLEQLPKSMQRTPLRNALKKAAKPIQRAAANSAPKGETGNLADSFVISTKLQGRRVKTKYSVHMFVGSTDPKAHLIEFGTTARYTKAGSYRGEMPEYPFYTSVWDKHKWSTLYIIKTELAKELVKAAKRLRTKAIKGTLKQKVIDQL